MDFKYFMYIGFFVVGILGVHNFAGDKATEKMLLLVLASILIVNQNNISGAISKVTK